MRPSARALLVAGLLAAGTAAAGDRSAAPGDERSLAGLPVPAAVQADPKLRRLWKPERSGPRADPAPLWDHRDAALQRELDGIVDHLGLRREIDERDLAVAFVDISDLDHPRVAEANGDVMMYAASLPKIAVLLAAFDRNAAGEFPIDPPTEQLMRQMIQRSSNRATTELMQRLGKQNIAYTLMSPRYRLYDPMHGGGLWVGKDYAKSGLWRRDPLHNLSHGATAMQVARFYYMLEAGKLVSPEHSRRMKRILSGTAINHKFAAGLGRVNPEADFYRKSGTWRSYHADSVLVERDGRGYIAVGLSDDPKGGDWLNMMVQLLDDVIFPGDE